MLWLPCMNPYCKSSMPTNTPKVNTDIFTQIYKLPCNTGQQKILFSKRAWNSYIFCGGIKSWTRCCLQNFPNLNSFPVIICWNFQNSRFSQSHIFLHWPKNFTVYRKEFESFKIFLIRNVSLIRCCLRIFPSPHSFPENLCWNFENSKFLLLK